METFTEISKFILNKVTARPSIAVICGSGLGGLANLVNNPTTIPYTEINGFPKSTVPGHAGNLVFGELGSKSVMLMQGRFHPYEGYSTQTCTIPIRVMHLMGIKIIILTNAAGGLNPEYNVGDTMIIKDHINLPGLCGMNPLVGPNDSNLGERFIPLSNAYDKDLRNLAKEVIKNMGESARSHEGVYAMQLGPAYETVAELRMLRICGSDCVGMSTTHEVVTAKHMGIRVFGMSLVTNKCMLDYDTENVANHEEVLSVGKARAEVVQKIIIELIRRINL